MKTHDDRILKHSFIIAYLYLLASVPGNAQQLAAGGRHSLIICKDSTVESWGYNGFGQLGVGDILERHSGTTVQNVNKVIQVAGGLFHSLFLLEDGTVMSCGRNGPGNLGDGTNTNQLIPVPVKNLTEVQQVAGGGEHSIFLKKDGTVWSCGLNSSGQLGNGSNQNSNVPVQVTGLDNVVQVSAGAEFSLFLKKDGTVWACGHNGFGQFGNGTNTSSKIPVWIMGMGGIQDISAGEWHSLFLDQNSLVSATGRNQYGQLGIGNTMDQNLPHILLGIDHVIDMDAGGIHSVFLKDDGTVWSCGLNSGGNNDGQLGDGTKIDKLSPVQVIKSWANSSIIHAEATREHSLFLTGNGQVYGTGRNNYGQLGIGTFTNNNYLTPQYSNKLCNALITETTIIHDPLAVDILFPNPASNELNMHFHQVPTEIYIYNMYGNLIFRKCPSDIQEKIDIQSRPKQVYRLQCFFVTGMKSYTFLVE